MITIVHQKIKAVSALKSVKMNPKNGKTTNAFIEFTKEMKALGNNKDFKLMWAILPEKDKTHFQELAKLENTRLKTCNYESCLKSYKQIVESILIKTLRKSFQKINNVDEVEEFFKILTTFSFMFKRDSVLKEVFNRKIEECIKHDETRFKKYKYAFDKEEYTPPVKSLFNISVTKKNIKVTPSVVVLLSQIKEDKNLMISRSLVSKIMFSGFL